jgi:lysophospholipase L1-like esterase
MRKIGLGLLMIGLLASLTANILLFGQGRQYYLDLNATRLDPLGLNRFAGEPAPSGVQPVAVFVGDSRAASWPAPPVAGWRFINRGIGAQTTAQILGRWDAHLPPLQPKVVILQAGINDLKTIPLFPERQAEITANAQANLREMVERAQKLNATVIITTIFPVGEVPLQRRPFWSGEVALAVNAVNEYLRGLAGPRVIIFDAYAILESNGQLNPAYAEDELHLNAAGYEALNSELEKVFQGMP